VLRNPKVTRFALRVRAWGWTYANAERNQGGLGKLPKASKRPFVAFLPQNFAPGFDMSDFD